MKEKRCFFCLTTKGPFDLVYGSYTCCKCLARVEKEQKEIYDLLSLNLYDHVHCGEWKGWNNMDFGESLRKLRLSVGLSQAALGKEVGVSRSYVSQVECGRKPSLEFVGNVARAFGLPVRYMYCLTLEKPRDLTSLQSGMFDTMRGLLLDFAVRIIAPVGSK